MEIEELENEIDKLNEMIGELEDKINDLEDERDDLQRELDEYEDIQELNAELETYKEFCEHFCEDLQTIINSAEYHQHCGIMIRECIELISVR